MAKSGMMYFPRDQPRVPVTSLTSPVIHRCFSPTPAIEKELHMLGTNSQEAFGAVAFTRGKLENRDQVSTKLAFVFGKATVAMMKFH